MTLRIGWLSPLTPASGIGTFSHAITSKLPTRVDGEEIDLTLLYPDHAVLHHGSRRSIRIEDTDSFRNVLELFDLLVYNIGNNTEHHELIFRLLRTHPGIVVCHDYVYQHYLADRSMHNGRSFASFAALLMKFGDGDTGPYLARSRITSRLGKVRYSPWDSDASALQPMSEAILDLGSALVVHSRFARKHAEKRFEGPIVQLGMPHDQKPAKGSSDAFEAWTRGVAGKAFLNMVSFGHIQATKCIDLILEALAASKTLRQRVRYTIAGFVGDWDYFERLEDLVASMGLKEIVRFETGVSDARLVELAGDADLFINLRKPNTEGSSASLVEQLDTGRPVVVLDSGCYGEVPSDAAVKLPEDAGIDEIRAALEQLVARPERLPAIGRAGRAYAQTWTCVSYGERFVRFALEHRELLARRSGLIGIGERLRGEIRVEDEAWIANLARARAALRYLDRNVLMLDPELLMGLGCDDLCTYVAQVIFGIFDDARLHRALSRFFVGREGRALYWDCVKFSLIAEAVFAGDEGARERLAILGPCYDPEFWSVLESLPAALHAMTAALMILGRQPTQDEIAIVDERNKGDGLAKRLVLLEFLRQTSDRDAGVAKLSRWLEQPLEHDLQSELPSIEEGLECIVGSARFREHADLSGFHPQETDHAWTRGARGFIGLRLGPDVLRVEVSVRNVNPDAEQPATVALSSGTSVVEVEVRTGAPHVLALDIPRHLARADATTWLQLSTTRAGSPAGSGDTRVLGVCFMTLKVVTGSPDEVLELADLSNS